uniref:ABC transporter permease n=1 Tax=Polynucleobacter sp. TaxID=2029855 RepID=UPI004047135A
MLSAFNDAFSLLETLDANLVGIVLVSLQVSITALLVGCLLGMPLGAFIAIQNFPGRQGLIVVLNSLMGVPTVIVGVVIYLLLSRTGPLGELNWLFTPKGMILAQSVLTTPLIAALTRQIIEDGWRIHGETMSALRLPIAAKLKWLVWDCRFSLSIALLAGFARAISEVGAVMIVGGNIDRVTRTMTTAIALETSKGDLPLALALGLVLLGVVLLANLMTSIIKSFAERRYG